MYIGANADRITPRPEDFDTRNIRSANIEIIHAANDIFETSKFSALRTINLTRGSGNEAFVLSLGGNPQTYHSEKHFSLGELCVLKLLRMIKEANNNSMIIVDELEMALHPRAQVKMLKYLQHQASLKSLTVIFSTHSVTLLKTIDRNKIIYLEKQSDDNICPVVGCFPTYAIGNISADEESLPDAVMYVEDIFAREILEAFVDKFSNDRFQDPTLRPSVKVIPIGPFDAVVAFLERNASILPDRVQQRAVLDNDVRVESVAQWRRNENHAQLAKFQRVSDKILYLPFTPEVGLIEYALNNIQQFESALRARFSDNQIRIQSALAGFDDKLQGAARRNAAKRTIATLIGYLEQRTQKPVDNVREHLCGVFVSSSWDDYRPDILRMLGATFSNR